MHWLKEYQDELGDVRAAQERTERRTAQPIQPSRKSTRSAVQVLMLYRQLQREPMTVRQIQYEYGISRRTVYNYLSAIQEAGGVLIATETGPTIEKEWKLI